MSAEGNKQMVLRFCEEFRNRGNVDVVTDVFADDSVRHDLRPTSAIAGPCGARSRTTVRRSSPSSESTLVGGGHRVDPADPAVIAFVRRVLG